MRVLKAQQLPAISSRPGALAPARQGPLETFLTPDPLHSLVIDAPAIKPQGQLPDPSFELLLLDVCQRDRAPLGVAVLTCQPAGTTLRNPESILQNHDGPSHLKVRLTAQQAPSAWLYQAQAPTPSEKPYG